MDEKSRSSLLTNRTEIVRDLNVSYVVNNLMSDFVLTVDEAELIQAQVTNRVRAAKLLDILATKGQFAYQSFLNALQEPYPHLEQLLLSNDGKIKSDSSSVDVDAILLEGRVPPQPSVFVNRPEEVEKIREALRGLKDGPGWVTVHGMGGSGKSVLSAEALRSQDIIQDYFPGGVFWASIGQVDKSSLLLKIQNLCSRLDKEKRTQPYNIEEGKDRLSSIFFHYYPRSLLILDDLWTPQSAKAFDIQARTLVTTRDVSVTDSVSGKVTKVALTQGFTESQSRETLAIWTSLDPHDLPKEAALIYDECKGLPLCISMIGALLQEHPHRWSFYLKQLQSKRQDRVRKTSAYEYDTLEEAISMSYTNLDQRNQAYYSDFAMFSEDASIPAQVLATLWDEEIEIVEDIMWDLVKKSLAKREEDKTHDSYLYSIHDLQLDFLKKQSKDLKGMNLKFINKYKEKCDGNYSKLPDDGYIHWYLTQHLSQAGLDDELCDLLLNFTWLESKVTITGPAPLLGEYIKYSDCFTGTKADARKQFVTFVSTNAHLLVERSYDVVQLGLSEPIKSEVYKQAKQIASQKMDELYFNWCNKSAIKLPYRLCSKLHNGAVLCANFSKDNTKIISGGEDNKLKIWDSQSGQELRSVDAHSDGINYCCFSPDGSKLASCSEDCSAKVWDTDDGSLLFTVKHSEAVSMIQFSHNGKYLLTVSHDWTIKIMDAETGKEIGDIIGHDHPIKCCCFAPDDERFATCSSDTTVKVWNTTTMEQEMCYNHNSFVNWCCFSTDGQLIASTSSNSVVVWEARTGQEITTLMSDYCHMVMCCAWSPLSHTVIAGLSNFCIQVWDVDTGLTRFVFKGHCGWVYSVAFNTPGDEVVSASDDGTVIVWNKTMAFKQREELLELKREFDTVFSDDGELKMIVAPDRLNRVVIMDGDGNVLYTTEKEVEDVNCCKIDKMKIGCIAISCENAIAYGTTSGSVKIISDKAQLLKKTDGHQAAVRYCTFTADGKKLVTSSNDKTLKIWEVQGSSVVICEGHSDAVVMFRLFDKDEKIVSASFDGSLKVWKIGEGQLLFTCKKQEGKVLACDLNPDQSLIAATYTHSVAMIWKADSGELIQTLRGHKDCVRYCCFSPNKYYFATGDDQGITKIWKTDEWKEVAVCQQHDGWVTDIKFSPDSQKLITTSNNIKWWRPEDGALLQTFQIKGSFARHVHTSPDFNTVVTTDSPGLLYILKKIHKN